MTASAPPVIAVDGPAASGKGTIADGAAQALGFHHLDSGSLYRLLAFKALKAGIGAEQASELAQAAEGLFGAFVGERIVLEGVDVTTAIRSPEVSAAASRVAIHPQVRQALLSLQRAFRRPPGLVADGRDMGTVVFPDALLKVFVTASAEERARRRYKQLIEKGNSVTLESLLRDIRERDARDGARKVAPLRPADDAIILDTTGMSVAASIAFVVQHYRAREAAKKQ